MDEIEKAILPYAQVAKNSLTVRVYYAAVRKANSYQSQSHKLHSHKLLYKTSDWQFCGLERKLWHS